MRIKLHGNPSRGGALKHWFSQCLGTKQKLFRKTCSDELFYFGWILGGGNSFCENYLNTPWRPGHPGKTRTSQIPLFETQGRQAFEGGRKLFGHHPFAGKNTTPPGSLRTQKVRERERESQRSIQATSPLAQPKASCAHSRKMYPHLRWATSPIANC